MYVPSFGMKRRRPAEAHSMETRHAEVCTRVDQLADTIGCAGIACMPDPDALLVLGEALRWAIGWPARTALSVLIGGAWLRCLLTLGCAAEIDIIGTSFSYTSISVVDHSLVHPFLVTAALLSPLEALYSLFDPLPELRRAAFALVVSLARLWLVLAAAPLLSGAPVYALASSCWGYYEICKHSAVAAEAGRGGEVAALPRWRRERAAAALCDVIVLVDATRRAGGHPRFWAAAGVRALIGCLPEDTFRRPQPSVESSAKLRVAGTRAVDVGTDPIYS